MLSCPTVVTHPTPFFMIYFAPWADLTSLRDALLPGYDAEAWASPDWQSAGDPDNFLPFDQRFHALAGRRSLTDAGRTDCLQDDLGLIQDAHRMHSVWRTWLDETARKGFDEVAGILAGTSPKPERPKNDLFKPGQLHSRAGFILSPSHAGDLVTTLPESGFSAVWQRLSTSPPSGEDWSAKEARRYLEAFECLGIESLEEEWAFVLTTAQREDWGAVCYWSDMV